MENTHDSEILRGMARGPWACQWANEEEESEEAEPVGKCPKCGRDWYSNEGFCGCRPPL